MTKNVNYNVVFTPEQEGGYTVTVPALPGCVSYGENLAQARKMAKEAILLYIDSAKDINKNIPPKDDSLVTTVAITMPVASVH
jgi:predicted RNase H-like HicB family nuclease